MAFNWDDFSEAYALLDKKNPTEDDAEQYRTLSYTLGLVLSDELKSQLGISGIDEIKPEHFSAIKKSTEKFLYGCLSDSKYLEGMSDEDKDKMKDFFEKHWKDGIPDEFMEKALPKYSDAFELGLLPKDEVQKIANIAKNLKELGAEDALEHFLNDNNSPNGDTVVTYLTQHALAAQVKLDRNEHKPDDKKISPDVVSAIEDGLAEELNTLRTIKDNYTVIDWAKPNKRNFTAASLMETYDRGTDYYNRHNLPAGKTPAEKPSRQLEGIVPAPEDTNVDGLTPQQQGLEKKVANVDPNAAEDADNKHTKSSGKSRGGLKPRDVVDFFYEDVFLAALGWVSDKICNWLENAAKAYAERTKAAAQEAKKEADALQGDEKKAAKKIAAMFENTEEIINAYDAKVDIMMKLPQAIDNEWRTKGGDPDKWFKDDAGNPLPIKDADGNIIIDTYVTDASGSRIPNKEYTEVVKTITDQARNNPVKFEEALNKRLAMSDKDAEKLAKVNKALHTIAVNNATLKLAQQYLLRDDKAWVDEPMPDLEKLVAIEMSDLQTSLKAVTAMVGDQSQAKGLSLAEQQKLFEKSIVNFINKQIEAGDEARTAILEDATRGRFGFNNTKPKNFVSPEKLDILKNMQETMDEIGKHYFAEDENGNLRTFYELGQAARRGATGSLDNIARQLNAMSEGLDADFLKLNENRGKLSDMKKNNKDVKKLVNQIIKNKLFDNIFGK